MKIKRGDIRYYCGSNGIFKVKVADIRNSPNCGTAGNKYYLKILEVVSNELPTSLENILELGILEVWRPKDPRVNGEWHFLKYRPRL
jgi:hypothetical protein